MDLAATLDILARLVAFPTESDRSNLALIAWVRDHLAGHGVESLILPNAAGDKATLMATIGPRELPGIVLSGHTDVVPVAGQAWTSDPWTLRVADGRAHGRGAVDMKGFLALVLAAVPRLGAARLARPVHLVFSYDEETTCLGPMDAIARFGRDLPMPLATIVGEPTELEVADAHKSVATFETRVHGFEVHSSMPSRGANAVLGAALLIAELDRIAADMKVAGDPTGRFDPPWSTVHVGTIVGGTARNIVAAHCRFNWEYRGVPGIDCEALVVERLGQFARDVVEARLRRGHPSARIEIESEVLVPGLAPDPGNAAETLALALAGRDRTITVPFGSEAGRFQAAGIPTIVCGPGSIAQAHQPDEFVTLAALAAGAGLLQKLVTRLGAG